MGVRLMAIAAEGGRGMGRLYLSPSQDQEDVALRVQPRWAPETELPTEALGFRIQNYGMTRHADLFTSRQLDALALLTDLVSEARDAIQRDAEGAGLADGSAAQYADTVATCLALAVSSTTTRNNALVTWMLSVECPGHLFARSAISMAWDFAEANILFGTSGSFANMLGNTADALEAGVPSTTARGRIDQLDARDLKRQDPPEIISTDPPYYDNVPYADLSDFFYVWLRRSLKAIHPELFATLLTPKQEELIAEPFRFGGRERAARVFEAGLLDVFQRAAKAAHPDFPVTIYYAFKQAEADDDSDADRTVADASSGWLTLLSGLLGAGFVIEGTWPIRTERQARARALSSNAIASSIVLSCRPRSADAGVTDRRGFIAALKAELPDALRTLQHGNIAPVDLAQASIGPGMSVFSRYVRVLEPDGTSMSVRSALAAINQGLSEVLSQQEDDYDPDTRWAVTWFEQYGHGDGKFGDAEVLSKAKGTGVNALRLAGIVVDGGGKVRLKKREELDRDWDPGTDRRLTIWEVAQYLVRSLDEGGEAAAAELVTKLGGVADTARDLAYRLYSTCDRKKWADEALGYNALVTAWPEITRLAASTPGREAPQQTQLFS